MRLSEVLERTLEYLDRPLYGTAISVHVYGAGLVKVVFIADQKVMFSEQYSVRMIQLCFGIS